MTIDAVFWGAWGVGSGHSFHAAVRHHHNDRPRDAIPEAWRASPEKLWPKLYGEDSIGRPSVDRELAEPQGVAAIHHLDGWTAVAFYDRTFDRRYNCGSVFFLRGDLIFPAALAAARAAFPALFQRFAFSIVPIAEHIRAACSFCGAKRERMVQSARCSARICDRCALGARTRILTESRVVINADVLETLTVETLTVAAQDRRD